MSPKRTLNAILVTVVILTCATTLQSSHDTPVDTGIVEGDTMSTRRSSSALPLMTRTPPKDNNPDDTNRNNLVWTPGPAAPPVERVFHNEDPNFSSYAFPVMPGTMEKFGKLEEEPSAVVVEEEEESSGSNTVTLVATTPLEVATIATQTKDITGDDAAATDEWVEVEVDVNSTKVKMESSTQDPMYHITNPTENITNEEGSSLTTTTTPSTTPSTTTTTTIPTTILTTTATSTTTNPPTDATTLGATLGTLDAQTPPTNSTVNTDLPSTTISYISNQTLQVDMEGNSTLADNDSPTSVTTKVPYHPRTRPHRLQPPPRRSTTPAPPEPGPSRPYPTSAATPSTTSTDAADYTMLHMGTLPEEEEEEEEEEFVLTLAPDVGTIPASATNAIIISSVIGGCAVIFFAVLMGFCMWRQRTRTPRRPIYRPPDLAGTGGLTAIGGPLPALQFQSPKCAL